MINYEKLQTEAQRTKELVTQAVIIIPEDALELSDMRDIKKLAELVDERLKMAEERKGPNGKEESARISLPYVKHYNSRLLEIIEAYN